MSSDQFNANVFAIGYIKSLFIRKNGTPRQSSICPESKATLHISKNVFNNPDHALEGLQEYTHVWIIYYFHKNDNKRCLAKVHPPRLNGKSCGVFASRSPHRPNPIGLTLAKIDKIEGGIIHLSGIDMVDGTPVLDIKPYIKNYDIPNDLEAKNDESNDTISNDESNDTISNDESNDTISNDECLPKWVLGSEVPESGVEFTQRSLKDLTKFHSIETHEEELKNEKCLYCFNYLNNTDEAKQAIMNLLQADPRSVYRRQKCLDRLYYFIIDSMHITCWFDDELKIAEVVKINPSKTMIDKFNQLNKNE